MSEQNANSVRSSIVLFNGSVDPAHSFANHDDEVEWDSQRYIAARTASHSTCFTSLCRFYKYLRLWWSRTVRYCSRWVSRTQPGEQRQSLLGDTMRLADPNDEPDEPGMSFQTMEPLVKKRWGNKFKQMKTEKVFHPHRAYVPPKSSSIENSSRRTRTPNTSQHRAALGEAEGESFRVHSDEESSISSRFQSGTSSKERWIMNHGVLMSVDSDGPLREASDSTVRRLMSLGGMYAHQDHAEPITRQSVYVEGGETNSIAGTLPLMDDVATVLAELETQRRPIHTLDQLIDFLKRCADFLPVRIELEREGSASRQDSARSMEGNELCIFEFGLHFLGPLQPNPYTAVLSILEDIIIDDCDSDVLRLVSIHCSDLCFSSHISAFEKNLEGRDSLSITGGKALSHDEWQMKSDLDDMMPSHYSLQKQQQSIHSPDAADDNRRGYQMRNSMQPWLGKSPLTPSTRQDYLQLLKESHMRLLGILKNVMDNMANTIHSVRLTRCVFAPTDIGQSLPLTLSPLVQLVFEQCPLSPAHIDELLQLARTEMRRHAASAISGTHSPPAFSRLTELQLSGTLTEECISELLNYLWDEVVDEKGTALRTLRLPSLLLQVAKGHPFIQAYPYVRVLPLV